MAVGTINKEAWNDIGISSDTIMIYIYTRIYTDFEYEYFPKLNRD